MKTTVPKRIRDKAMRAICDFHAKAPEGYSIGPSYLYDHGVPKTMDAGLVVDVLCAMGYITFQSPFPNHVKRICLTDAGKCYFEKKSDITREKVVEWVRYCITTAIAVAAFIKSFFF